MIRILSVFMATVSTALGGPSPVPSSVPSPAPSALPKFERARVSCKSGKGNWELSLRGFAKTADDEEKKFGSPAVFTVGKNPGRLPFAGQELQFVPAEEKSPCGKTMAFTLKSGQIAVPFFVDDRPFESKLAVAISAPRFAGPPVVWESKDSVAQTAATKAGMKWIQGMTDGLRYVAWNPRTDATSYPVTILGKTATAQEEDFLFWRKVRFVDGKIEASIDSAATYETSKFRLPFRTEEAFNRAFDLSADGTVYRKSSIVLVAIVNGVTCVQPTRDRKVVPNDKNWFCAD